jgi:hypothetical protein
MDALKRENGSRSWVIRLLPLVALGVLSGCVSGRFYWGPSLSKCSGQGSAAQFGSGACRNGAENYVAWKKSKHRVTESDQGPDEN